MRQSRFIEEQIRKAVVQLVAGWKAEEVRWRLGESDHALFD